MTLNNLLVDRQRARIPERWLANQEFVYQDSQGPPVNGQSMAGIVYDFRREVLWSSAQGVCLEVIQLLCEAEIHELDMTIAVEQHIFRLQIAVGNAFDIMEELENEQYFGSVKLCCLFAESPRFPQIAEYLTARTVFQLRKSQPPWPAEEKRGMWGESYQHVQTLVVREAGNHSRDKGVTGSHLKRRVFVADVFHLLQLDD